MVRLTLMVAAIAIGCGDAAEPAAVDAASGLDTGSASDASDRTDAGAAIDAAPVHQGPGGFAGAWLCQYTATTTFVTPVPVVQMSSGVDFVTIADGGTADLTIAVDGPTGRCDLLADRDGSDATVRVGQTCVRTSSGTVVTFALKRGHGVAATDSMLLDLAGAIGGTQGASRVTGSVETNYQCVHN